MDRSTGTAQTAAARDSAAAGLPNSRAARPSGSLALLPRAAASSRPLGAALPQRRGLSPGLRVCFDGQISLLLAVPFPLVPVLFQVLR